MDGFVQIPLRESAGCIFKKGNVPADIGKYYKRGVVATAIPEKGTGDYLLDANGYVLKSVMKKAQNGAYYCTDSNGQIYRNKLVKYGNFRYYFGSNGKRATWTKRWAKKQATITIILEVLRVVLLRNMAGRNLSAPVANSLAGCIFDSNGNHYTDKWTSAGYYFKPSESLQAGLTEIDGKKYIFESSTSAEHKR